MNREALIAELVRVRERGYAIANRENSIGAPVLGPDGRVAAALSISGRVFRMDLGRARSLAPKLKQACAPISAAARV